ncbi:MAG: prepilin-type N-terminal cleavage/methylation domain-containing protein [Gaiellales bacterium]|nr:MAG: prepilin-type N-terminal cleavage/methylation domain-containing protein [Gaiellales bacterium]
MPDLKKKCKQRLEQDPGFTMVEVLVAMAILTVIMAGMLSFLFGTSRNWQSSQDTAEAIDNARIGLNRMTRELKQSSGIITAQPDTVTFEADFGSGTETITYRFEPGEGSEPGKIWRESSVADGDSILVGQVESVQFDYYGSDYRCDTNGDGVVTLAELNNCGGSAESKIARVDITLHLSAGDDVREFVGQAWCRNCAGVSDDDSSGGDDSSGDGDSDNGSHHSDDGSSGGDDSSGDGSS